MTKKEKRELIKKRGNILDIKEIKNKKIDSGNQSPIQEIEMIDKLEKSKTHDIPLVQEQNANKWMGHDQITVETAPRQPRLASASSKSSAPSQILDGQIRHLETAQYLKYVEEYNRITIEREIEMRRIAKQSAEKNEEAD